jgi:hypothetical protein
LTEKELSHELDALAAETFALQAALTHVLARLITVSPDLRIPIAQGFDDAANFIEHVSLVHGRASGHMPKALKVIEELRTTGRAVHEPPLAQNPAHWPGCFVV